MHPERAIVRYVVEGLPVSAERRLRAHLRDCERCRARYDAERRLFAALSGKPDEAGDERAFEMRLLAEIFPPVQPAASSSWHEMLASLLWAPRPALAAGVLAVVALAVLITAVVPGRPSASGIAGTVVRAAGAKSSEQVLDVGAKVRPLDVVRVEHGGMLELSLERGGLLRVFPDTTLVLGRRGESVVLDHGKVWCLPDANRGSFEVTTATATARVLGTSFIVAADDDATDVRVVSGVVEVQDAEERGRVVVRREQSTRVLKGQGPTAASRSSVDDIGEWQRFWDALVKSLKSGFDSIERELKRGPR